MGTPELRAPPATEGYLEISGTPVPEGRWASQETRAPLGRPLRDLLETRATKVFREWLAL